VGKASGKASRLSKYNVEAEAGMELYLDVHRLKPGVKAKPFEDGLRAKMKAEGHTLPNDNSDKKLGRSGPGWPYDRGVNYKGPPMDAQKMIQYLQTFKGNAKQIGAVLNVHRRTVQRWAAELNINAKSYKPQKP
jgi:hypothetical protein